MRATKLLSVSVTLWAVVVGADGASAGVRSLSPSIKPNMGTPPVRGVGVVGGTRPTGITAIKSGAMSIRPSVGVGGTVPTGIKSGAMTMGSPWETGERCQPGLSLGVRLC